MKHDGPYRDGGTLARLIAPDHRRRNAALLVGLGVSLGVSLTLLLPHLAGSFACDAQVRRADHTFYVPIEVRDSANKPVVGAMISRGARLVGTTDVTGLAYARVQGNAGAQATITVTCPSGHRSPQTLTFPLSNVAPSLDSRFPRRDAYTVRCEVDSHRVTVAIDAVGGAHIPVLYLNREVARTDERGIAAFHVELPTDSRFSVTLDTSKRRDLHPANPTKVFHVGPRDETVVFAQAFDSGELGALTVVCLPRCNEILDNDVPLGPGHIFNRPSRAGRHTLRLSTANGTSKTMVIDVEPGQTREVRVAMDR